MKKILAIILATITTATLMTRCGNSKTNDKLPDTDSTTSLLVDADKESIDYAKESEDAPVYGDTDYEYHSDTDTNTDTSTETDSNSDSDILSIPSMPEITPDGNNGGGAGGGTPTADDSQNPTANERLYELFYIWGKEFSVSDTNEYRHCDIESFDKRVNGLYEEVRRDDSLKYNGYFANQGNFTNGYWIRNNETCKVFLETDVNGVISSVVMTDLSNETMLEIGDKDEKAYDGSRNKMLDINSKTDIDAIENRFGFGEESESGVEKKYLVMYEDNYATVTFLINEDNYNCIEEVMIRRK